MCSIANRLSKHRQKLSPQIHANKPKRHTYTQRDNQRAWATHISIVEADCAFAAIRCPSAAPLGWAMSRRTLYTNLCGNIV